MLPRRCFDSLSRSERLLLRHQWLRGGQCARCFHASASQRAEGGSNEQSASPTAPQRGLTRQQRAAMISEEVKMIQRDHPSPSFGEPDPNTLRPPGASQTVDPEAAGKDVPPGRMGENDVSTQEGPTAQGVGRVVRADDEIPDTSRMARGVRSPQDSIEETKESGESVLEATSQSSGTETIARSPDRAEATQRSHRNLQTQRAADVELPKPTQARLQSLEELANGKYSAATISGSGFQRVMADRISTVTRRTPTRDIAKQRASRTIIESTVKGNYDRNNYLKGAGNEQPVINQVSKVTTMNGTCMSQDTTKFMNKVRSLMPAVTAGRAPQRREQEVGKAP